MNVQELVNLISGMGPFVVSAVALWRSFRNDGRHWIEKLFVQAKQASEQTKNELDAYKAQNDSIIRDHVIGRREFERHEREQSEDICALRDDFKQVGTKIDRLTNIMLGRRDDIDR